MPTQKRKNLEMEIEALENLHALGEANSTDLGHLGIAYHNYRNFAKAVEFYRLWAATEPNAAPFFNMGLVFNDAEVSQDADAADAYRRALALKPDYELARERLDATKRRLAPLAERARTTATGLVQPDECFHFYVSPFEVLQIGAAESVEELDVKAVQRAKKRLLQEIDLNDGKVSWLDDCPLDKSRALALDDDLHDEAKRRYHWAIFQNKRLLRFLTRGDIEHFLYSEDYFPRESLNLLDEEPEFRAFLSKPFARQYNFMLTRAIERRLLPVVEVLFDGRRWVEPEDDDICFEGASKRVNHIVDKMRELAEEGQKRKVGLLQVQTLLEQGGAVGLFNLLPTAFRSAQSQLVGQIRSLAIACHNEHSDSELSAQMLGLCKIFQFKSADLNKQLEEDSKAIENIVAKNRRHSISVLVRRNQAVYITHTGIKFAGDEISAADVEAIRWGICVRTVNGIVSKQSFTLIVSSDRTCVPVQWDSGEIDLIGGIKRFFSKKDGVMPIAQLPTADQEAWFSKMIDAVIHYLVPSLVTKLAQRLRSGMTVSIWPCSLSQTGIAFRTGFIFSKDHLVPWNDVVTSMHNGEVAVFSRRNSKALISMSARDIDNAVLLPILSATMRDQAT